MNLRRLTTFLLLLPLAALAQKQQYINDEITVSLRDGPRNDATFLGLLKSGDAVTVLENLGEQSFAKVRTADGRVGWVTARFLSDQPAAASLLADARGKLEAAQVQLGDLQKEVDELRAELRDTREAQTAVSTAAPVQSDAELSRQNALLRAQIAELRRRIEASPSPASADSSERREMMLTGATVLGAGVLLGMLLQWIAGRRRRHWSDF